MREILTGGEFGLGRQAWLGRPPLDESRVGQGLWLATPRPKPPHGFFTSSWDELRQQSAWTEYVARTPRAGEPGREVILLDPQQNARIFVVDSADDYQELVAAYPHHYDNPVHAACPHWARLATETSLDAVHVTAKAVYDPSCACALSWEVESTLWFRPAFHVVT